MIYFYLFKFGENITVLCLKVVWYEAKETVPFQNRDKKKTIGETSRKVIFAGQCCCSQCVLTDTWILYHFLFFYFIVIKLTTDNRQNEPINHRLRAGQESSHCCLPMKAVRLLWTHRSSSLVPCLFPSFKRTLLSVRAKVWFKQPSRRKRGLNSLSKLRSCDISFPLVYRLCQADPVVPVDLTPLCRGSVPQTFFFLASYSVSLTARGLFWRRWIRSHLSVFSS